MDRGCFLAGLGSKDRVLMSARERSIYHSLEHRNQGVFRQGIMDVGQALLPTLRLQQGLCAIARRPC